MSDKIIEMTEVNKWFGDFQVLKDINLTVSSKQKIVVCGPSGSGKSTLIRCINRLEEHQKGKIVVDGIELSENTKNIEQVRAEVGMVFQQFNLFPHLSIVDNCALAPIWVKKIPKKQAEESALKQLEKVQILDQARKFPGQLSGGQQQRAAIARALCMEPKIMLFDEPTSALDMSVQSQIIELLKTLQKENNLGYIFISHDLRVIKSLAHKIIVLKNGKIVEKGNSKDIFTNPKQSYTKKLISAAFEIKSLN